MNDRIDLDDLDVLTHTQFTLSQQVASSSEDESSDDDCVEAAVENPGTIQEILEIPSSIPQKRKFHKYEKLAVCLGDHLTLQLKNKASLVVRLGGKPIITKGTAL